MLICTAVDIYAGQYALAILCLTFIVLAYCFNVLYTDLRRINNYVQYQQHIITKQECRIIERNMKIHDLEKKLNESKDKATE
jgi:hypothetical protein